MFLCLYERYVDVKDGITFLKRSFQKDWKAKRYPQFHNCIEFAFLVEGSLDVMIENKTYTLSPGDLCYIDSFKRHKFLYHNGSVAYIILIHPSLFNERNGLADIRFAEHSHPRADTSEIREFLDFSFDKRDLDSMLFKSAFVDLLTYLLKKNFEHFPKEHKIKQEISFFESIRYISDHYREDLHVADIAAKFGYTPNYYSAVFKKNLGISFRDFLNQCRISECNRLKKENRGLPVEKLAELCGFGSLNAYYRAKKKLEQFEAKWV